MFSRPSFVRSDLFLGFRCPYWGRVGELQAERANFRTWKEFFDQFETDVVVGSRLDDYMKIWREEESLKGQAALQRALDLPPLGGGRAPSLSWLGRVPGSGGRYLISDTQKQQI